MSTSSDTSTKPRRPLRGRRSAAPQKRTTMTPLGAVGRGLVAGAVGVVLTNTIRPMATAMATERGG